MPDNQYTKLITSEHRDKPNFMATVAMLVQASIDTQDIAATFPSLFDINQAAGDQLDKLGAWIGASRNLTVPLTGVFFSLGVSGLGLGEGTWFSDFDASGNLIKLADDNYRILLLSLVASNQWDGTIPGAYQILQLLYELTGTQILIQDNQDMSISIIVLAGTVDAVFSALLHGGLLVMRPAGVHIAGFFKATVPVFGLGSDSPIIGGLGQGNWLQLASF
jgi:hypothetical protein